MTEMKVSPQTAAKTDTNVSPKKVANSNLGTPYGPSLSALTLAKEWAGSEQERKAKSERNRALLVGLCLVPLGTTALWALITWSETQGWSTWFAVFVYFALIASVGIIITGLFLLGRVPFWMSSAKSRFDDILKLSAVNREIADVSGEMSACPSMGSLMHLNRTETIGYHELTLNHATRSFKNSQRSMAIGLAMLAFCLAIVAFPNLATDVRLTVAALGGISTVLSGYITKTFLKAHSEALAQLNRYFNQPLVTGYLLNAERIASTLDGAGGLQDQALCRVIDQALHSAAQASESEREAPITRSRPAARWPRAAFETSSPGNASAAVG